MLHTCPILTVALAQVQCIILSKYSIDRLRSARVAGGEKPNMIITVICDVLGEENNGTTIACMNLIRGLKKRGHTVRVVCMDKDKMGREGYYIVPELNLGPLNPIVHLNGVSIARADKSILEYAIRDCDLVHTALVFSLARCAIKIAKKYNKPITSSFHCQAENFTAHIGLKDFKLANELAYYSYYSGVYSKSDCIHYPTQFIRDVFEGVTKRRTNGVVISNGVNAIFTPGKADKPSELRNKFVIISVGRLSSEKNHNVLVRAVALSKYKDTIHLIIAGDGPRKGCVKYLAKRKGVDLEINFYSRSDLVNALHFADLYVHPAEVELESIACLEAICSGLVPIIADSQKSAARYFALDDRSLFKNKDPRDLARKIDYWIEHPKEREFQREQYIKSSMRFEQEQCMDAMERMMIDTYEKHMAC